MVSIGYQCVCVCVFLLCVCSFIGMCITSGLCFSYISNIEFAFSVLQSSLQVQGDSWFQCGSNNNRATYLSVLDAREDTVTLACEPD